MVQTDGFKYSFINSKYRFPYTTTNNYLIMRQQYLHKTEICLSNYVCANNYKAIKCVIGAFVYLTVNTFTEPDV